MLRALWLLTGLAVTALLILAIHADPELWEHLLIHASQQARHAGNGLDHQLARVLPSPRPGATP